MNLGQDLIRPTTQRLTGQRAITSYFKSNPDKAQLGKAALRLMQSALEGETLSYTAEGADWSQNSMIPPRGERLDSFPAAAEPKSLEMVVDELEARVVVLTAVQEGLLTRLARLEAKLAQGVVLAESAAAARAELRPRARKALSDSEGPSEDALAEDLDAPVSGEPGLEPASDEVSEDAAAPSEPGPASAGEVAPAEREAAARSARPVEAPEPAPLPERVMLTLPPVHELAKCVALLVGGDVSAKEGDPPLAVNRTTKDCYAASILDDSDQTVGMILMDLKAAVFLGGTLMMLPRSEIEQQLKTFTPGEDSIAASAEICNALAGAINGSQDQHVRVGQLQKFEFKAWSWVTNPSDRRDLEDSFGGRTVVASRPPAVQIG